MRRRYLIVLTIAICVLLMAIGLTWHAEGGGQNGMAVQQKPGGAAAAALVAEADGVHYEVTWRDKTVERFTPQEYARRLYDDDQARSLAYRLMNVESRVGMAWVAIGLGGQMLFAGRMIVQWLVSEKNKRSVVPVSFWWMSLGGASMLIAYFLWRWDPVGMLGQATGWFIYVRNLMLIHGGEAQGVTVGSDPGPEPELPGGA